MMRDLRKITIILAFLLSSCVTNPREDFGPIPLQTQGVYVLNEGIPGRGNSTLTFYVPDSNKVYPDIFKSVNGRDLGDSGWDIAISGTRAFIVMSGSNKIEVIRTADDVSVRTVFLKAERGPFNIIIQGSKAYVSNYYAQSVTVFDINNYNILRDSLGVDPYPQGMATALGKVYVCNSGRGEGRTVSVIDASTDRVVRNIEVGDGPTEARITSDGMLWVLCTGSSKRNTSGKIFVIQPSTDAIIDSISVSGRPVRITTSFDGFAYVVGDNRILKYNTRINWLVTSGFVVGSATSFLYSVAVDDFTGDVYVGDATRNFDRNGEVRIYRSDGLIKGRFDTGIVPGTVTFKR